MKLPIDHEADALNMRLDGSTIVESEQVAPCPRVVLDFNVANQVVGVEIFTPLIRTPNLNLSPLESIPA